MTKYNLAHSCFMQERWAESKHILLDFIEIQKKKQVPAEHPGSIDVRLELLKVTKQLRQLDDAELMKKNVVEMTRKVYGPDHKRSGNAMDQLAAICTAKEWSA